MIEKTLIIIKPDGVKRGLIGEIIRRYEQGGLTVVALKMLTAPKQLVARHYPAGEDYVISLGKKSERGGTVVTDYRKQGLAVLSWLRAFISSGPVVPMVLEGEGAIQKARDITGYTDPAEAAKGTIRGDFGQDSIKKANSESRPVHNLIHASGNPDEARKEIAIWFPKR